MAKAAVPSNAQAKYLARVWGDPCFTCKIGSGYELPTLLACLKHGWVEPNGITGTYANGTEYREHVISEAGLDALEGWLRQRRYKRTPTPGGAA